MNPAAKRQYAASLPPEIRGLLVESRLPANDCNWFVGWAVDQLVKGKDSPSLRILAGLTGADLVDCQALFKRTLSELGFSCPDEYECGIFHCRDLASQVLNGEVLPCDRISKLWKIAMSCIERLGGRRHPLLAWCDDSANRLELMGVAKPSAEAEWLAILEDCQHLVDLIDGYLVSGRFRVGFDRSLELIKSQGWEVPAAARLIPPHLPDIAGEAEGLSFFRTKVVRTDFNDLTLPWTCFLRSLVDTSNFRNADIRESSLTWCDWRRCLFEACDLSGCDLRQSNFEDCCFYDAVLDGADLRGASFQNCNFGRASMKGTRLPRAFGLFSSMQAKRLKLSEEQRAEIRWVRSVGDLPPGG